MYAVTYGNNEIGSTFLGRAPEAPEVVNAQDTEGWTALIYAATNGATEDHNKVVSTLLAYNADIDLTTSSGTTALMYAAEKGHNEVLTNLLEHNADVNARDDEGLTALMLAAKEGQTEAEYRNSPDVCRHQWP